MSSWIKIKGISIYNIQSTAKQTATPVGACIHQDQAQLKIYIWNWLYITKLNRHNNS